MYLSTVALFSLMFHLLPLRSASVHIQKDHVLRINNFLTGAQGRLHDPNLG
jgi:hypothetical protein